MSDNHQNSDDLNIKDQIKLYLAYWPWFLLSLLLFLSLAYLNLRYSTYSYVSEATILIKDDNNASLSEIAIFEDLGLTGSSLNKSQFENEIEILKSKRLLRQVAEQLKLNIRYYNEGSVITSEVYRKRPFFAKILPSENIKELPRVTFIIKVLSDSEFEIKEGENGISKKYTYGEKVPVRFGDIILIPNTEFTDTESLKYNYFLEITNIESVVNSLRSSIKIASVSDFSSILKLSLISTETTKAEAILNALIEVYNEDAINDRNLVSKSTAEFIENRLEIITQELDSVETDKVVFNEQNRITDIRAEGQLFLENINDLNKKKIEVSTQIALVESMIDYLDSTNDYVLLPSNLGVESPSVNSSVQTYNELVTNRERLLKSSTEENPVVVAISNQLDQMKLSTKESLSRLSTSLEIENKDIIGQESRIGGKISRIPSISKSARDIERQQSLKESLYLYLLQKREETAISLAVTAPKSKIVDSAYSSKIPVSPKPKIIYLAGIFLAFVIPFGIIFLKLTFDTKIHNRVDLEKEIPLLPILGEIPIIDSKESEVIQSNDRSVLAESFRILRTNLGYFIKSKQNGNVIFVTSTIKGEGKTFVAYNLAITLRSTGKSVLLIGADIRNPQIHRYIDKNEWTIGLSEYLFDSSVQVDSITNTAESEGQDFDVILSGRIPPNPAELLMSDRFENIIQEVRGKYDYVIVDTAPTLLVTDTLLISQLADTTVYVCRAEYTDKKLLQYPKELYDEGKIKNIAFAINGIKITNFGYGSKYGYGYGYGQDKPSVFSRLKRMLRFKKS